MTAQPRGGRSRRSGRRPGWLLVTALLILAILASSTLVFTSRVDLLRLAVILSLWAAVMAAFASVTYRRQSELDQARARDMKFVYDLQLNREVAARREYELAVEAHLRRQLAGEQRAQAADEMIALRAELASLRSNLEIMLGTDLGQRPALEAERVVIAMPAAPERVESSRITPVATQEDAFAEEIAAPVFESPIIDVPEEPLSPPPVMQPPPPPPMPPPMVQPPIPPPPPPPPPPMPPPPMVQPPEYRGSHRQSVDAAVPDPQPEAPWRPPEVRRGRHWSAGDGGAARAGEPSAPESVAEESVAEESVAEEPVAEESVAEESFAEESDVAEPVMEEPTGQHTGGHSVADLMSRLQVDPTAGGGRRRRKD